MSASLLSLPVSPHLPQNPSQGELEPLTVAAVPDALLTKDCHFSADRIITTPVNSSLNRQMSEPEAKPPTPP